MLSTIHRRHLISFFETKRTVSLKSLKEAFVETKEMNQTTLYRILEKFQDEGMLHKAEFSGEKFFTLCDCGRKNNEAVKLKCCVNCHEIEENHTPLALESLKSETVELVKYCKKCKNNA